MNKSFIVGMLLVVSGFSQGIPPRAKADDYAAKVQVDGKVYAASLIPAKQVKHIFAFDISATYLVFEVACFADADHPSQLLREDFAVKGRTQGELTHQVEAETVASVIQQQNTPKPPSHKPDMAVGTAVGYESGTDPVTGRKVHGVYTEAGVGVGVGNDSPRYPTPGGLPEDRELLQTQLRVRSLPEGKFDHPVAGYLFFPKAGLKADANGKYPLEHLNEAAILVPEKTH